MKKKKSGLKVIDSISEVHRMLGLPGPEHPLVSVINLADVKEFSPVFLESMIYNFYQVCMKKDFTGKMKYGLTNYDFDEGTTMAFISPGQVLATDAPAPVGWLLIIHPDFIQHRLFSRTIRNYGFFSYETSEGLFLSEKEEATVVTIMKNIEQEYRTLTDAHTQDIIIAQIEVLLNYCKRFYDRQFITRKKINNDLVTKIENILSTYFENGQVQENGLPTVEYISKQLNVSPHYLSDMLRVHTGQNTQQHIQNKLIEKAKETLSTTSLSVSEIAYQLGFKYPQSFNKLFKNKTNFSPLEFRRSFN